MVVPGRRRPSMLLPVSLSAAMVLLVTLHPAESFIRPPPSSSTSLSPSRPAITSRANLPISDFHAQSMVAGISPMAAKKNRKKDKKSEAAPTESEDQKAATEDVTAAELSKLAQEDTMDR